MAKYDPDKFKKDLKELNKLYKELKKESVGMKDFFTGAKGAKQLADSLKLARLEIAELNTSFEDTVMMINQIGKEFNDQFNNPLKEGTASFKKLRSIASDLEDDLYGIIDLEKKQLLNIKKKTLQEKQNHERIIKNLIAKSKSTDGIDQKEKDLLANLQSEVKVTDIILEQTDKRLDQERKIAKTAGVTGAIFNSLSSTLGKVGIGSEFFEDGKKNMREAAKSGSKLKVVGAGISSIFKGIGQALTDPVVIFGLLTKAFVGLLKIAGNFAKKTADIGKAFLGMGHNIKAIKGDIMAIAADEMYLNFEEAFQAMKSLNAVAGTQVRLTQEQTMAYQKYTNLLGLSEETTQGLFKYATLSGRSFDDMGAHIGGIVAGLNQTNDQSLNTTAIMEDVANASAATAFNLKSNPDALAKAAFSAKRLGMTMDQITSAAENTLDFESSIEKEMAAELLLNKNLNLEQLRYASLTGDVETQAKEINRILAENIDATEGNVILQDALAASLGMSREDMFKANQARLLQNKLGKLGAKDRELALKKLNALIAAGATEEEALVELQKIGLENIQDQAKASQALSRLSETFKEKFLAGLEKSKVIDKINDMVKNFADGGGMEKIAGFIEKAAGALGGFISGMIDNPKATLKGLAIALGGIFLAQKMIPQLVTLWGGKGIGKSLQKLFSKKTPKTPKGKFYKGGQFMPGGGRAPAGGAFAKEAAEQGGKIAGKNIAKTGTKVAAQSGVKIGAKLGAKGLGKALLKRIPGLGALAGVGFAIGRVAKGDMVGAAMELASGGASLLDLVAPGVGLASGLAIDAAIVARDIKKATNTETAADFISRPGQPIQKFKKDDVIVGGTSLGGGGGNVDAVLQKILLAIESGGDVYMDGNKVGKSLALATSNMG